MKELRQRSGRTAQEVAMKLGIAVSTVGNWEQGKFMPRMTPKQLQRLMEVYGCTFDELVEAEDEVKG